MDAAVELLLSGIARTTVCTTLAALATLLLLPALGICSARVHRTAWVLVILQGWILVPLTFTVSVPSATDPQQLNNTLINNSEPVPTFHASAIPQTVTKSVWQRYGRQAATAAWVLGTLAVLGFYMKRYYWLVTHVPIGSSPESGEWNSEWRAAAGAISPRANVHFRMTSRVGPLLCFVPFVYLILVPRLLWSSLSRDDRIAILRHELAHLEHGDLWKNLVIRVLALPQWFNPLVWLAVRRFEEAGEWACDEEVLASSNLANTGYAAALLRVAGFSADAPCGAVAASGGVLTRRVTRLLSSSDKEVSKMKNLAVPLLLLGIAATQAVRIESVLSKEPARPAITETRAEAVARWREGPYRIGPSDVLAVDESWKNFDVVTTKDGQGNIRLSMREVQPRDAGEKGPRLTAGRVVMKGQFLVAPDGTIALTELARLNVAGMTVEEAEEAIADKLSERFGVPQVKVEVAKTNSKVVYVVNKRPSGDIVTVVPCTKETNVLLVLAEYGAKYGEDVAVDDHVYVQPRAGHANRPADRLEVDLGALLSKRDLATNYALVPGDRIFVTTDIEAVENSRPARAIPPTPLQPRAIPPTPLQQIPYFAPENPYSASVKSIKTSHNDRSVSMTIRIVDDFKDSFAEIEGLGAKDVLICDSPSTLGLLRVLEKNKLAKVVAAPTLITVFGRTCSMGIEALNMFSPTSIEPESVSVEFTPAKRDEGILFTTKVSLQIGGRAFERQAKPIMKKGQTCVMRLSDAPHVYLLLTRE